MPKKNNSPLYNYRSPRDYKVFNMGNKADPPFKLKSGNTPPFKQMGAVEAIKQVDTSSTGYPSQDKSKMHTQREIYKAKLRGDYQDLTGHKFEKAHVDDPTGTVVSKGFNIPDSPTKKHDGTKSTTTHYADGTPKSAREVEFSKRLESELETEQNQKEKLLGQGFTQEDADKMIASGAVTGRVKAAPKYKSPAKQKARMLRSELKTKKKKTYTRPEKPGKGKYHHANPEMSRLSGEAKEKQLSAQMNKPWNKASKSEAFLEAIGGMGAEVVGQIRTAPKKKSPAKQGVIWDEKTKAELAKAFPPKPKKKPRASKRAVVERTSSVGSAIYPKKQLGKETQFVKGGRDLGKKGGDKRAKATIYTKSEGPDPTYTKTIRKQGKKDKRSWGYTSRDVRSKEISEKKYKRQIKRKSKRYTKI